MKEKHKKRRRREGGIKTSSQCFFFMLGTLALIYVSLLVQVDVPKPDENNKWINPSDTKPRLEEYIQGWNVTKNVNWLLDFSIVGFPKTGAF